MREWIGYILSALSFIAFLYFQGRAAREARRIIIEDQATEKATLKVEAAAIKETTNELKDVVKENYRVLAGDLETLKQTMLQSDTNLGNRIDQVVADVTDLQNKVRLHSRAIENIREDIQKIRTKGGD
jgi:peptidoglycan hydrolase CwlO-like protein